MLKLISVGSDPEVFLRNGNTLISSVGLFPGTKQNPFFITETESVQVDNVAIEFGIKPTLDPEEFIASLNICLDYAKMHLEMVSPGTTLDFSASGEFDDDQLQTREAKTFGCEPDFNAWNNGEMNTPPCSTGNIRSCGGHIHLGLETTERADVLRLIRLLDKNVGTYTTEICGDKRRQSLYGKAGAFRYKEYGVEYRTPSISWLKSEESIREVFARINKSIEEYNEGIDADVSVKNYIENGEFEFSR